MKDGRLQASDLMIGDWARSKKWAEKPFKLTSLNANMRYCYGITSIGGLIGPFLIEELEPIPLAKIHLTKNGFEATNESDTVFVYNDGYEVRVEFDDGMPIANVDPCIILRIEFADRELFLPIEYLHELQHAMHLCGIDKKIEL